MNAATSHSRARSFVNRFGTAGAVALAAAAVAGCGAADASSGATHAAATQTAAAVAKVTKKPSGAQAKIDRLLPTIEARYQDQIHGPHAIQVLHQLARDPTLLRLLAQPNLGAARSYIHSQYWNVWYHWHVSRMRVMRGSQNISEQGVPFVIPTVHTTLRGAGGRNLGTVYVSMQDEIGFVRLMHREYPVQVVIRGSRGELRTSMYSAASVKLPATGTVKLGGHRYLVRSFHEPAWGGETVTIWILMKG
jgi:hypothetical protein